MKDQKEKRTYEKPKVVSETTMERQVLGTDTGAPCS